ncbi:MAG TPA: FAD-binding oxidoreductase [Terriglobia bacterium]|jgi:glycolate oxidase FAD binding subunit|nr:FAD-binding oxidoreductase [Terriglobia bacterium]
MAYPLGGLTADIQTDFASTIGGDRVSCNPDVRAAFAVDGITPGWVLYPATVDQVAEMLKCAASRGLAVIPCGNGSKLGIGAQPQRYDVALCLRDLNRATYYEPDDLVASVEPGMSFGALQQMLDAHRLWVPLDPAGGAQASVGGILAANAAGPLRLRYGGPRDMILGMKIATAGGKIVKTGGRVVKNVAGYDLAKLLIGSYGTLGVIVEATFKLHPQVAQRTSWVIEIEALTAGREFRRRLLASPLRPLRAVLLHAAARARVEVRGEGPGRPSKPAVWIEAGGSERVMARYQAELSSLATAVGSSMAPVEDAEARGVWDRVADFGNWLTRDWKTPIVLRAALPIAAAEEFLGRTEQEAQAEACEAIGLVQLGVGVVELGLVTGEWQQANCNGGPERSSADPNPESRTPNPALIARLRQTAQELGGSLVVTRCPADLKPAMDIWGPVGDDFEVMRKLKAEWDPKGTLSPGWFLGGI